MAWGTYKISGRLKEALFIFLKLCFKLISGWVNMLYHEWAGAFQAGQARGGVHPGESRDWPGPSLFPFAVFPLFPGATYN